MKSIRPSLFAVGLVALIAIMGCILRGTVAVSELLWLDELHTSWSVNGSIVDVAPRAADGNQSPLYFWLVWISVSIFGHSEFSLRLVSIIAGVGTMLVAGWFTWRWTGSKIASVLVAWLITVDANFVYYSSEARPYAMLEFLSVIQVSLFFKAIWGRQPIKQVSTRSVLGFFKLWPDWSLAITSILLINIHLTSIWLIVAETIFLLVVWFTQSIGGGVPGKSNSDHAGVNSKLMGTAFVVAIGCLPMLIQLTTVFRRKENWQCISSISGLWTDVSPTIILLVVLPAVCLAVSRALAQRPGFDSSSSLGGWRIALVFLWFIVPIGSVAGLDYFGIAPMAVQRYTLVGAVAMPVFAGLCVGSLATVPGKLVLSGLIVAFGIYQNPMTGSVMLEKQVPQFRFENWATPISEINTTVSKSRRPVFLFANLIEDHDALRNPETRFQNYLLFPVAGLYRLDASDRKLMAGPTLDSIHFNDVMIMSIKKHGGAWVIVRSDPELANEIGDEVRIRTAMIVGKRPDEIRISTLETSNSPVYLISVDW